MEEKRNETMVERTKKKKMNDENELCGVAKTQSGLRVWLQKFSPPRDKIRSVNTFIKDNNK